MPGISAGTGNWRGNSLAVESTSRKPKDRGSISRLSSRRSSLISIEHAGLLRNNNKLLMPCVYTRSRYHSIGLKVKEKQEPYPGRQSDDRMGENSRGGLT